ncbi:hypothetical protein [Halomicrococcus sp. NG-SE-24]|uniref:hypothetical protein n=1 Tax=Halomicrococcus sp. NG-SE-24 TaxID=3436928 RepID=UPI003D99ED4D
MSDVVVERLSPDKAFELMAHETRFRILRALDEVDDPLAFTFYAALDLVDDREAETTS